MEQTPNYNWDIPDAPESFYPQLRLTLIDIDDTLFGIAPPGSVALADPGANGIVVRTSLGTTVARSLTAPAAGFTISNNDGVSGNPTFALAHDLAALEALSGTGFAKRTGSDAWAVGAINSSDVQVSAGFRLIGRYSGSAGAAQEIEAGNGLQFDGTTLAIDTELTNLSLLSLTLRGATSGLVTIQPAAVAGTWTLTLPTSDGDAGQALVTNGAGVTSWETVLLGGQTITLTGEVTGSGTTTIPTTITAQNSAFWRGKVTDETGTGLWVFNDSPTLITPVLGVASGTSLVLSISLTADNVIAMAEMASPAHVVNGQTSGAVTIQSNTGTWTLTLPADDGANGQVLTTDGNGVTSWAPAPGANTALSNLAGVAINTSLLLGTSDGGALGSATKMWSDLFLASGAVVNFNAGDVTITHSADSLAFAGAASGYFFDSDINTTHAVSAESVFATYIEVSSQFYPSANDGAPIGDPTRQWSDLFLASGAVVNFNNDDVTITHSANALTIQGGNVGIGTSPAGLFTSDAVLHIQGATNPHIRITDTTNNVDAFIDAENTSGNMGTTSNHGFNFFTNNALRITVSAAGVVAINNLAGTGSRTVLADASGNLSAPVSDARLKTNVTTISDEIDVLAVLPKMRGVFFDWTNRENGQDRQMHFIAQEVEQIFPSLVHTNSDGYKGLSHPEPLAAYLIEVCKAQQKRIEQLESMID